VPFTDDERYPEFFMKAGHHPELETLLDSWTCLHYIFPNSLIELISPYFYNKYFWKLSVCI